MSDAGTILAALIMLVGSGALFLTILGLARNP